MGKVKVYKSKHPRTKWPWIVYLPFPREGRPRIVGHYKTWREAMFHATEIVRVNTHG